jgi:hypothetical protein
MGVSPYIDRLVAREKKQREQFRDIALEKVIEWHRKRVSELDSAIAGVQSENSKMLKYRAARQMHQMTLTYLERMNANS